MAVPPADKTDAPDQAERPARPRGVVSPLRQDGTPRNRAVGGNLGPNRNPAAGARRRAEQVDALREQRIERLGGRATVARGVDEDDPSADPAISRSFAESPVMPAVRPARMRKRHFGVLLSLLLMVFAPIGASGWYLWTKAVDQYESRVGFAVRAEGQVSTPDLFGGLLGAGSSSTAEDMNILNAYILSQEMVSLIDAKLDLRKRYSMYPEDPVFAFDPKGTIEDLVSYWQRMVQVDYDPSSGLMELTFYAFTPQDAQDIATAVLEENNKIINNLSAIARDDSTRFAREALENARARASDARAALAEFRAKNRVADPTADVASQIGVVSILQQQLATELVELDLLRSAGKANDPRIGQLERRITAIEGRIEEERANLGIGVNGAGFAEVLSEYERLTVEKTFAEQAYLAALAGSDMAMSTASQQSRYLASYVSPTLAEASTAPARPTLLLVIGMIAFFIWASSVLVYYALRDRR